MSTLLYQNETKTTELGGTHAMHGISLVTLTDVTKSCVLCGTCEIMLFQKGAGQPLMGNYTTMG